MVENSKIKKTVPKTKEIKKVQKVKQQVIKQELEKKVAVIRKKKKTEKEEAKKIPAPKPKSLLKLGDKVRMTDGIAIGTIDKIEKKKAFVNYGTFKTKVNLAELEKI